MVYIYRNERKKTGKVCPAEYTEVPKVLFMPFPMVVIPNNSHDMNISYTRW
jgi:hypothetical protein